MKRADGRLPSVFDPETDERLWVALVDVVRLLHESASWVLARIAAGELRHAEHDGVTYVLAEDLLALVRAQLDARSRNLNGVREQARKALGLERAGRCDPGCLCPVCMRRRTRWSDSA
jgi:hypothetical protein